MMHLLLRSGLLLLAIGTAAPARAADCDALNLLADRQPVAWHGAFRPNLITDGVVAIPGDPVAGNLSAALGGPTGASIEWDLDRETEIGAGFLQAGADGTYVVEVSPDRQAWTTFWQPQMVGTADRGLRERVARNLSGRGRYLRLRPTGGTWPYAVSELQLFCQAPARLDVTVARSTLPRTQTQVARAQAVSKGLLAVLTIAAFLLLFRPDKPWMVAAGLATTALAFGLAAGWTFGPWGALLGLSLAGGVLGWRQIRSSPVARPRNAANAGLLFLAAMAPLAYTQFGAFLGHHAVHYHDAAHYYLGAKYAPELGYTGLYRCLVEADVQEARWPSSIDRPVRDLRTNRIVSRATLLADGVPCASRFPGDRWAEFRQDAMFFQSQMDRSGWETLLLDHGYNATPAWTWFFAPLVRGRTASVSWLMTLIRFDEVVYAVLLLGLLWGFGLRAGVIAALVIGLGFPWISLWTGGGIGRSLWLALTLLGLAASVRGRPVICGILLGGATALQVFPGLLFAGPLFGLLIDRLRHRPAARHSGPALLAGTSTILVLLLLSLRVAGIGLWSDFLRNSVKHMATPFFNRIGLGQLTLVGCPRVVVALLGLGFVVLFVLGLARAHSLTTRLSLSCLAPLVAFNLSSYYLTILAGASPLLATRGRAALGITVLVLLPQMGVLMTSGVPGEAYYAAVSALYVVAALLLLAWLCSPKTGRDGFAPPSAGGG